MTTFPLHPLARSRLPLMSDIALRSFIFTETWQCQVHGSNPANRPLKDNSQKHCFDRRVLLETSVDPASAPMNLTLPSAGVDLVTC
ncbi:hypothetical protein L596_002568 [Steinernema carpocapsae]|uniref:Uncharacterized protein n=1 Tax=Steinernema carpocapsae TaxID=34508 RepID=A0A4U8UPW7_STECR|nr:hypothetical protein L596_002568 [Steinernema carpocapsae]